MTLIVTPTLSIPDDEISVSFSRSGGAGGQNVNKVSSRVQLRFQILRSAVLRDDVKARFYGRYRKAISLEGEVLITSDKTRDQAQNIRDAEEKLVAMILSILVAPTPRRATKPSRGAVQRRLTDKRVRSETKQGRSRAHDD
jgi:ribosome-associated protein